MDVKEPAPAVRGSVEWWLQRYECAKKRWKDDFDRMRENMKFTANLQREGQDKIESKYYIANLVIRNINQKVASLYARNPQAKWERRPRRDFVIWDEKVESLLPVIQKTQAGIPLTLTDMALVQDYIHGMQFRALLDNVGDTLQKLYQYNIDEHDPNFKMQLKQLVRRTCITGVGYVRVGFERDIESILQSTGMSNQTVDRAKRAKLILDELIEQGVDESDQRWEQLRTLFSSMGMAVSEGALQTRERLVFDFLPSTSVIPDEHCTCLKGFVGARRVFIEKRVPLEEARAFFERPDLKVGETQPANDSMPVEVEKDDQQDITIIEVLDKATKTSFFIAQGHKDYLQAPEPLEPAVGGFWPLFALTFNDIEADTSEKKVSIFPPSDVDLMRHPQKEWNRTREELRNHRKANAPTYLTQKGWLTEEDKNALIAAQPNQVIELSGVPPDADVRKAFAVLERQPIDPNLYNTDPLLQDILLSVGAQEANIGPANPNTTATGQTIAEQSRNIGLGSNVDDLDDFLTQIARAAGDIALQSFSAEVVKEIVGPGAVWPDMPETRQNFLKEIYLKIVASSSGRPNNALEIAKWERVAPILSGVGANPMFMVRETLKRLDDRIDVAEAFPLIPPSSQPLAPTSQTSTQRPPPGQVPAQQRPGPGKIKAKQPLQQNASEGAVPLAAA